MWWCLTDCDRLLWKPYTHSGTSSVKLKILFWKSTFQGLKKVVFWPFIIQFVFFAWFTLKTASNGMQSFIYNLNQYPDMSLQLPHFFNSIRMRWHIRWTLRLLHIHQKKKDEVYITKKGGYKTGKLIVTMLRRMFRNDLDYSHL